MTADLPDRAADRERECTTRGCPHPAAVIGTYRDSGAIFPDTAYCQQCADLVGDDVFTPDTAALAARPAPGDGERDEDGLTVTEQLMARVIWDEFHNQWHGDAPDIEPRTIAQAITAALAARPAPDDGEA